MLKPPKANFLLLELIRRSNKLFRSESVVNDKKELALKSKQKPMILGSKDFIINYNLKRKSWQPAKNILRARN